MPILYDKSKTAPFGQQPHTREGEKDGKTGLQPEVPMPERLTFFTASHSGISSEVIEGGHMPTFVKCGSQAACWAIVDKENYLKEYCDNCF